MSIKEREQDPVTGHIKQSTLDVLVGIPVGVSVLIFGAVFMPEFIYNNIFYTILLLVGLVGISSSIWLNVSPNLWAKFLKFLSFVLFWGIIAYRSFAYLLPDYSLSFGALIAVTILVTQILPVANPDLVLLIRNEMYAPKTKLGKSTMRVAVAILPLAGFIGASMEVITRHSYNKPSLIALALGPIAWFNALIMPFATKHPVSPWETKKK